MNNKYWEEDIETMPTEQLRALQLQRLKKTIQIASHSPYYKKVFSKHGITSDSIQKLEDIRKNEPLKMTWDPGWSPPGSGRSSRRISVRSANGCSGTKSPAACRG